MKIHILTTNKYLCLGMTALAEKCGYEVNIVDPHNDNYLNKLGFNDLAILHVDRTAPTLLTQILKLSGRIRLILIGSYNLRLEAICNANEILDEKAPLEHIHASLIKSKNLGYSHQEKHIFLSTRERIILIDTLSGTNVNATAKQLGISAKTVYAHKLNAYRKLGAKNIHDIHPLKNVILELDKYIQQRGSVSNLGN